MNNYEVKEGFNEFPSPCGDVVLKFMRTMLNMLEEVEFPSPCGDVVLKYRQV